MRSSTPEQTTAFLRRFEQKNPFNMLEPIYRAHGQDIDPRLGGCCLTLAARFRNEAKTVLQGWEFACHNDTGESRRVKHVAVIGQVDGGQYFIDPSLFAQNVAPLVSLRHQSAEPVIVPVHPALDGRSPSLRISGSPDTELTVALHDHADRLRHEYQLCMHASIPLPPTRLPNPAFAGKHAYQELVMRILEQDGTLNEVAVGTTRGDFSVRKLGRGERTNAGNPDFDGELRRLSCMLGMKQDAIRDFFRQGWQWYREDHPDHGNPPPGTYEE